MLQNTHTHTHRTTTHAANILTNTTLINERSRVVSLLIAAIAAPTLAHFQRLPALPVAAGRAVTDPDVPDALPPYTPPCLLVLLLLKLGICDTSETLLFLATPATREVCGALSASLGLHMSHTKRSKGDDVFEHRLHTPAFHVLQHMPRMPKSTVILSAGRPARNATTLGLTASS